MKKVLRHPMEKYKLFKGDSVKARKRHRVGVSDTMGSKDHVIVDPHELIPSDKIFPGPKQMPE